MGRNSCTHKQPSPAIILLFDSFIIFSFFIIQVLISSIKFSYIN